jgi:glycosyltransferase involved in cell wall biosynthesis
MKILQITAAYKPAYIYGGPTMSVAKLCEALVKYGTNLEVLTTTANGSQELDVAPNIPIFIDEVKTTYFKRLTKDHTHFSPSLLLGLRKQILIYLKTKKNNPSSDQLIVHIHAWWNLVSIMSCSLAKWYQIPVVLSPRGMLTNYTLGNRNAGSKAIIHSLVGKRLLKYCHIHATSDKEKQDILQHIKPKSISIIHNLVSLPSTPIGQPTEKPEKTSFNLFYLSRIEEKKGLELLFEALRDLNINWTLTIAGSGEERYVTSLKELVEQFNLQNQIKWIGQVDNSVKFKLLSENDLMILTSYNENFANVVIESLSVGTPVLISNQVGLATYVTENELGWVCDLTIESIQEEILTAYNNAAKRVQIREKAPQIIQTDFSSDTLVEKYINFYKQII